MLHAELARLPNGIRLVTIPDGNAESVTFAISVASGSRHEKPRFAGISHFIEHMLFKGTERRTARDINRAVECRGGSFNAFTGEETTMFFAKLPCEFLPVAVDVICDMYANSTFPDREFERERNVVLQELKMYADDPSSVAAENLGGCLFPGNALGKPIGGNEKALKALAAEDLRAYWRRAYVPSATVVAVTGRFDPGDVRALLSGTLGKMKKGRPAKYEKYDLRTPVTKSACVERDVQQTQVALGWRLPFGIRDNRRFAVSLLNAVLGSGMSSRLFETVREKRGLSYDIRSSSQMFADTGTLDVTGGTDPARAGEMVDVILREAQKLKEKRLGPAELRRVKDYVNGNFRLAFEKPLTRIMYYSGCVFLKDRVVDPETVLRRIEDVTSNDILEVANTCLVPKRMAVSRVVPK